VLGKEIVRFIVSHIVEHQNLTYMDQLTTDRFMLGELVQILENTPYTSQIRLYQSISWSKGTLKDGMYNKPYC